VKRAASLRQRKYRDREGAFLVEGADLVAAGIAAGYLPQAVFLRAELADELSARLGLGDGSGAAAAPADGGVAAAVFAVSERVAAHISTLETPPDAMAVFPLPQRPRALADDDAFIVYADGVQDPGNLGTLLRAVVVFGATALVTAPGSVDPFGPKAVRASMGAIFAVPVLADVSLADVVDQLCGAAVYGLSARGGAPLDEVALRRPAILAVGAERAGLSPAALACVTELVTIPLAPGASAVESLNAGVAGAIALYALSRRSTEPKEG